MLQVQVAPAPGRSSEGHLGTPGAEPGEEVQPLLPAAAGLSWALMSDTSYEQMGTCPASDAAQLLLSTSLVWC